jgi:hypothetical protein
MVVPRHSSHLAKKLRGRLPAFVVAQNILMRRLGLSTVDHVESSDYGRYLNLFKDGLTEEQVHLIRELFASRMLLSAEGALVDGDN